MEKQFFKYAEVIWKNSNPFGVPIRDLVLPVGPTLKGARRRAKKPRNVGIEN